MKVQAVILARVSSRDQEETGYSLPAQTRLLKEYAERKNLKVGKVFEIAESASGKIQRRTFNDMMTYVTKNNVQHLVCEKVDRLTRNFKDTVMIDDWINEDSERRVHLVKDNLTLHRGSSSQEKLMWGIKVVLAKNFSDNLREEVAKGFKEKLESGWLPATPPVGYMNTGVAKRRIQIPNPETAPLAILAFELYAAGNYSIATLLVELTNQGLRSRRGKKLSKANLHELLQNPYYIGKIRWMGKLYEGKHDPLITDELFDTVQELLRRRSGGRGSRTAIHNPLFKGMMVCAECGHGITWEKQKERWYGSCNTKTCSKKPYAKQDEIEAELVEYFDQLSSPSQALLSWVKIALYAGHATEAERYAAVNTQLNRERDRLQRMLDSLYDDKLEGIITRDQYDIKAAQLTKEKEAVVAQLTKLDNTNAAVLQESLNLLDLSSRAGEIYSTRTVDQKRELLGYIFSNISLNGKKLRYQPTKVMAAIADRAIKTNTLKDTFELDDNGSIKEEAAFCEAAFPIWQG